MGFDHYIKLLITHEDTFYTIFMVQNDVYESAVVFDFLCAYSTLRTTSLILILAPNRPMQNQYSFFGETSLNQKVWGSYEEEDELSLFLVAR